jgi:hypothetical protein
VLLSPCTIHAWPGAHHGTSPKLLETPPGIDCLDHNVTAVSAVSAVRTTTRHIPLASKADATGTTISPVHRDRYFREHFLANEEVFLL